MDACKGRGGRVTIQAHLASADGEGSCRSRPDKTSSGRKSPQWVAAISPGRQKVSFGIRFLGPLTFSTRGDVVISGQLCKGHLHNWKAMTIPR
jgi:hypothetical protein